MLRSPAGLRITVMYIRQCSLDLSVFPTPRHVSTIYFAAFLPCILGHPYSLRHVTLVHKYATKGA